MQKLYSDFCVKCRNYVWINTYYILKIIISKYNSKVNIIKKIIKKIILLINNI